MRPWPGTLSGMNNFLHSLPWTLALALAQAGEGIPVPLPDSSVALLAAESGLFDSEGSAPSMPQRLRLSEADPADPAETTEDAS
jgi:hypothetical protein